MTLAPRTVATCASGGRKDNETKDECREDMEDDMSGFEETRKGGRDDCEEIITDEEEIEIGETEVKADDDEMGIVPCSDTMMKFRV